jgi:hypothetical protein
MDNFIEELRQEYLANYYCNKINKMENKEEILPEVIKLLDEIIQEERNGSSI